MSILDDLPAIMNDALGESVFLDATLTRTTQVAGTNAWDAPASSSDTSYTCKAIHDTWSASWLASGLVATDDLRVIVLADSLEVEPQPGDRITIRSETFTIVPAGAGGPAVSTDPARATWELRCRK